MPWIKFVGDSNLAATLNQRTPSPATIRTTIDVSFHFSCFPQCPSYSRLLALLVHLLNMILFPSVCRVVSCSFHPSKPSICGSQRTTRDKMKTITNEISIGIWNMTLFDGIHSIHLDLNVGHAVSTQPKKSKEYHDTREFLCFCLFLIHTQTDAAATSPLLSQNLYYIYKPVGIFILIFFRLPFFSFFPFFAQNSLVYPESQESDQLKGKDMLWFSDSEFLMNLICAVFVLVYYEIKVAVMTWMSSYELKEFMLLLKEFHLCSLVLNHCALGLLFAG